MKTYETCVPPRYGLSLQLLVVVQYPDFPFALQVLVMQQRLSLPPVFHDISHRNQYRNVIRAGKDDSITRTLILHPIPQSVSKAFSRAAADAFDVLACC